VAVAGAGVGTAVEKYCDLPPILVKPYNTPLILTVERKQVCLLMESCLLPSEASISP